VKLTVNKAKTLAVKQDPDAENSRVAINASVIWEKSKSMNA